MAPPIDEVDKVREDTKNMMAEMSRKASSVLKWGTGGFVAGAAVGAALMLTAGVSFPIAAVVALIGTAGGISIGYSKNDVAKQPPK